MTGLDPNHRFVGRWSNLEYRNWTERFSPRTDRVWLGAEKPEKRTLGGGSL